MKVYLKVLCKNFLLFRFVSVLYTVERDVSYNYNFQKICGGARDPAGPSDATHMAVINVGLIHRANLLRQNFDLMIMHVIEELV